jgi:exodeoxyribonuclease VII large subunit
MPKTVQSQWDFETFVPPEKSRPILTVSELTASVRRLLESQIGQVWVTGEITNLRIQSSGHIYFSVKDSQSQLSCVLFRNEARAVPREVLQDGKKVVLKGELTVYEARGQYQLRVAAIELQGIGALQAAFEKLKEKLKTEGLFAPQRKRPLPPYPQRIGLVTSPTGAALRDVIHVLQRRHPALELILATCRVQGIGAAEEIACAIQLLNDWDAAQFSGPETSVRSAPGIDLILVTRGGGSLEDLWAFNEEIVARAIFHSKIPVVSAVGHEIDFTISDFVADIRAATPSAAAEIITEHLFASRKFIFEAKEHLREMILAHLETRLQSVQRLEQRLARSHPKRRLQERAQRLDDLQNTLWRCTKYGLRHYQGIWQSLFQRLRRVKPSQLLPRRRLLLEQTQRKLNDLFQRQFRDLKTRSANAESKLRLLSPEHVLERGYSITMESHTGKVIRSSSEVTPGTELRTRLKSGEVFSKAVKR